MNKPLNSTAKVVSTSVSTNPAHAGADWWRESGE